MTTLRTTFITGLVGLSLALGACDKETPKDSKTAKGPTPAVKTPTPDAPETPEEPQEEQLDDRVVKAADLAQKIEANPEKSDEILAEAGMDRAQFDSLLHEVSTPELAEQYRLARARAEG